MTDTRTFEPNLFGTMTGNTCALTLDDGYDCGAPVRMRVESDAPGVWGGACDKHVGEFTSWVVGLLDPGQRFTVEVVR